MPFIPAIIGAIAAFAATTIGSIVIGVAVSVGLGFVQRALAPKPKKPKPAAREVTGAQADGPWQIVYGQRVVSGLIPYRKMHGANNQYFTLPVAWCYGGADGIEEVSQILFGDEVAANGTTPIAKYSPYMTVQHALGTDGQALPSLLGVDLAADFPAGDNGAGHAYTALRLTHNEVFRDFHESQLRAKVKGRKVLDTRTGTVAYSANPVLCIRDYMTNTRFGLGFGQSLRSTAVVMDDDFNNAQANICDELVPTKAGGTRVRYALSFAFTLDAEPGRVLMEMLAACGGMLQYSGGKWRIIVGAWRPPRLEVSDADLRGPVKFTLARGRKEIANGMRGVFLEPTKWQPANYVAYAPADALDVDGGIRLWREMDFVAVTEQEQCQALAKQALEFARRRPITLQMKWSKMALQPGDTFRFTHNDWVQKPFLVVGTDLVVVKEKEGVTLGIDVQAIECDASVYSFDAAVDFGTFTAPSTSTFPAVAPAITVAPSGDPTVRPTIRPGSFVSSNPGRQTTGVQLATGSAGGSTTGWRNVGTALIDVPEGADSITFDMLQGTDTVSGVGNVIVDTSGADNIGFSITSGAGGASPQTSRVLASGASGTLTQNTPLAGSGLTLTLYTKVETSAGMLVQLAAIRASETTPLSVGGVT